MQGWTHVRLPFVSCLYADAWGRLEQAAQYRVWEIEPSYNFT